MTRGLRWFIAALWLAFALRGATHALVSPIWDGFDEPFHHAYIAFVAEHGRPPGFKEPSFPQLYVDANRLLPSMVGHGAPTFTEWAAMPPAERDAKRTALQAMTASQGSGGRYAGENYERQHGPVFYMLAAPLYVAVRNLPLNEQVVFLRLFCVLLASIVIPVGARALHDLGGPRAVLLGLPFVALLPNTPFAVIRVSNEALAWPLFAIAIAAVVRMVVRPGGRAALVAGIAISLAAWTRMSALVLLPGPVIALAVVWWRTRRVELRQFAAGVLLPTVAIGVLVAWNHAASGSYTGLVQQTVGGPATKEQMLAAVRRMGTIPLARELAKNHVWSGGWGFVKPGDRVYVAVATGFFAFLAIASIAAWRRRRVEQLDAAPLLPLVAVVAAYLAAFLVHMFTGALAAVRDPNFPTIGAEGWYLDELRVAEAAMIAWLLVRATRLALVPLLAATLPVVLIAADTVGLFRLMLPRWSGLSHSASWGELLAGAGAAAPMALPAAAVALLVTAHVAAAFAAAVIALTSSRESIPRTP